MAEGLDVDYFPPHTIIFGVLGFLIIVILSIGVIYDITKKIILKLHAKNPHDKQDHTSIDLLILIYSNITLIFIYTVILLLRFIIPFKDNHCPSINILSIVLFQCTRTIMFIIFIRRLQVIFSDTLFDIYRKYVFALYVCTAIYFISCVCYFNWSDTIFGSKLIYSENNQNFGCVIVYNSAILVSATSLLDITISSVCLYLFTSPLFKLIAHQDDEHIKNQLFNIVIKIAILYGTAIVSSIVYTILKSVFSFGFYYGIFDGMINGMLLILLHPLHNMCYKKICCALHKCCIKSCNTLHTKTNKVTTPKDPKFKLAPISILEDFPSNITAVSAQTPVDILLTQSIATAYKRASQSQPAFSPKAAPNYTKPKSINELLAASIKTMNAKMLETETQSVEMTFPRAQSVDTPVGTTNDVLNAHMEMNEHKSRTYIVSIKDAAKQKMREVMKQRMQQKCDKFGPNNTARIQHVSSAPNLVIPHESQKSNTLKIINRESNRL